jgi:copper chaperone NosL
MKRFALIILLATLSAGCDNAPKASAPEPHEITADATGRYCGMALTEHAGPKGQIFVAGIADPIWFSSVHDAIAFTLLPEEPKDIAAIYVTDIGKAASWDVPGPGTWIDAKKAWFVIGSKRSGGMGGAELVPFGAEADANSFVAREGGRVVRFDQIPRDYVLADGATLNDRGNEAPTPDDRPASGAPASKHQH